jgi:hypothetical protein
MKVTKDGFVWKLITPYKAKEMFYYGMFDIYLLYDDDSESKAETMVDINTHEGLFGIEVGHLNRKTWQRNNLV